MFSAKLAICFGGCRLALRGLGRIASMATLSVLASFIRAKTRAASSDVRPSHLRVFFSLAPLGRPDSTFTSISSCPKAVAAVRRAHDGDSRLKPTAQRRLALLALDEEI